MNGDRFDDLARALARLSDGLQSRRSLIASAITGAAIGLRTAPSTAAPSGRRELEFRNQDDQADPLIYETAFNLQFDVDKIFQFVRDEVAYDPYAGVLRGARGTLWGLAGNAADQAVLLAALLNAALIPTRYVIGELPPDSAERLLGTAFPDEETTLRRTAQVILPPIPAEAALPLTSEERAFVEGLPGFAGRFRDSVDQHATAGLGIVADALTRAGITIPTPALALPELEENQHVWVQYSVGTQWIDLDPSMPGSEAGEVHATDHSVHDQLPPDIFHRVTLRLVAEQVVGGTLERRELISHSAPSADLVGVPLTIFHPQAEALKAMGQQITGEIGGFRNYMTTLLVGEEVVSGLPVTFATGEGVFDVVGSTSVVDGDTIGEWLEIEIGTPDGVRRVTRELFDRVGLANRETSSIDLAAIPALDLVDAGDPESSFLPLAGFWSISVLSGPTPASFLSGAQGQDSPVTDFAEIAHTYHYVRDVFSLRSGQVGARTYFDEPNLTAIVVRPTVISADSQTAATGIDLLYRSLAVVGAPESDSPVHPLISAGVLGHAVEQGMAEAGADPLFDLPLESTSGVGRVFAAAKAEGIATIVLDPGVGEPTLPMVSEEALIRIREALSLGLVVIVPERSVSLGGIQRSGWWLVDPVTGSTFDQMDDGGGAQLVEYIFAVAKLISCGVILFAIAAGIYFVAVGTSLTLVPSRDEGSSDADVASAAAAARAAGAYGAGRRAAGSGAVAGGATALCAM